MLYNPNTALRPLLRHHCRNPRCGAALREPTENRLDAFCCAGCFKNFYRSRCLVCERPISQKTKPRRVCDRQKCRAEFRRHSGRLGGTRYLASGLSQISARNPVKSGIKNGSLADRPFRIIAGPVPPPINLQIPLDPEFAARLDRLHSRIAEAAGAVDRRALWRTAVAAEVFDNGRTWRTVVSPDWVAAQVTRLSGRAR